MSQTWPLRRVGLRVRDVETSLAYYQRLGLAGIREDQATDTVGLGAGTQELLTLRHVPGAFPRPQKSAGLFHFAILLPSETELGTFLQHCLKDGIPIDGASDHLVSQALYLSDPEGNGIEVYADRPREEWQLRDGKPIMDTLPLKAEALLAKAREFQGFPAGTVLGHMHLNVSNLDESVAFYEKQFGLELMTHFYRQAGFISWDHYHHHVGLNTWNGPNASHHQPDVAGLDFFEIVRPDLASGTYQDPNGITVIVSQ